MKHDLVNYTHPDQFGKWLGYQLTHMDKKEMTAEMELLIREDHLSPAGRVHGGVVSSLFDYGFGATVFSTLGPKDFCSTVELKVNYLKPLELGDKLKVTTRVIFRGKRLCVLHGFLYRNDEKNPSAMASATFNIVTAQSK